MAQPDAAFQPLSSRSPRGTRRSVRDGSVDPPDPLVILIPSKNTSRKSQRCPQLVFFIVRLWRTSAAAVLILYDSAAQPPSSSFLGGGRAVPPDVSLVLGKQIGAEAKYSSHRRPSNREAVVHDRPGHRHPSHRGHCGRPSRIHPELSAAVSPATRPPSSTCPPRRYLVRDSFPRIDRSAFPATATRFTGDIAGYLHASALNFPQQCPPATRPPNASPRPGNRPVPVSVAPLSGASRDRS